MIRITVFFKESFYLISGGSEENNKASLETTVAAKVKSKSETTL
jgi:hypothetical protein